MVAELCAPSSATTRQPERALRRMPAWTRLAVEAVRTESPAHELFQSFACLGLTMQGNKNKLTDADHATHDTDLQRLAKRLRVETSELRTQMLDYKPLALHIFRTTGCSTLDVWEEALLKRRASDKALVSHPQEALLKLVMRRPVYMPTISDVEQSFTRSKWLAGECRGNREDTFSLSRARAQHSHGKREPHGVAEDVRECGGVHE